MHIMPKLAAATAVALPLLASAAPAPSQAAPGPAAVKAAKHAVSTYRTDIVDTLAKLVSFNTVADPKVPFETNPQFAGFKNVLKEEAARLGFDYADEGYVVRIGYGSGTERVGVITHGDVQPVDPTKWKKSPFELDRTSEAGRLLARGSEDDKGPIATALYAMKAIKDQGVPLTKRIELYVYMAEESDWGPLEAYLKTHTPPQMNITLDSEYPVVTAEKGYGMVGVSFPQAAPVADAPAIAAFRGGFFGSQIPEDAQATIANATPEIENAIRARTAQQKGVQYTFTREGNALTVKAKGVSAHSSKPEDGVNAIAMLADALRVRDWPATQAGNLVAFINDMVGTGYYGEKWGKIAYKDGFMGPMTFAPTVIKEKDGALELGINVRRPQGKTQPQLKSEIETAFAQWQGTHGAANAKLQMFLTDPWLQKDAPQIPTLLGVFSYFTGVKNAKPMAIGGGTNSRLFPNAVSFGPAMPGTVYTGHSEHEFITLKQLLLNLEMYTAVLVELAK